MKFNHSDRRIDVRYPVDFHAQWTRIPEELPKRRFIGTVTNISRSGLFIRSDNVASIDDQLNIFVSVVLPDYKDVLRVSGCVKTILKGKSDVGIQTGMGIMFTSVDMPAIALLDRMIKIFNRVPEI